MSTVKSLFLGLLIPGVFCLAGCGQSEKGGPQATEAEKVKNPVAGKVTIEGGRNPARVQISFVRADLTDPEAPATANGTCDEYGYFEMTTNTTGDGCPPGKYKVRFYQSAFTPSGGRSIPIDALGEKYKDQNTSGFEVEIPTGGKKDLEFKITSLTQEEVDALLEQHRQAKKGNARRGKE